MSKNKPNSVKVTEKTETKRTEIALANRELAAYYRSLSKLDRLNFREEVVKRCMLTGGYTEFYNFISGRMTVRPLYATIINVIANKQVITLKS